MDGAAAGVYAGKTVRGKTVRKFAQGYRKVDQAYSC